MALPAGTTLVDSFPFDSSPNLVYTDEGYPRGDRSVDAWTMQKTFAQFFSDGVFGTPGNALEISKGPSGMTCTIQPGMFIINGGMGGIKDEAMVLTLDSGAAQGNTYYGIMLRYDNNTEMRSLGIRVAKQAGSIPEPDQTSVNVMEYRLGYVMVPNGNSDVANATVVNEKGTEMCPYAAPFVPLDLSGVTADARAAALKALQELQQYIETNEDFVQAALDGTTAGNLQAQINQIMEMADGFDLENAVDGLSIEYAVPESIASKKLKLKDGGVETRYIADGSVTVSKLSPDVIKMITPQPGSNLADYTYAELAAMMQDETIELSQLQYLVGQERSLALTGYGTYTLRCVSIGSKKDSTNNTRTMVLQMRGDFTLSNAVELAGNLQSAKWGNSTIRSTLNSSIYEALPDDLKANVRQVKNTYVSGAQALESLDHVWLPSVSELIGSTTAVGASEGAQFEWWASNYQTQAAWHFRSTALSTGQVENGFLRTVATASDKSGVSGYSKQISAGQACYAHNAVGASPQYGVYSYDGGSLIGGASSFTTVPFCVAV